MNAESSIFSFLKQPYPFYYEGKKLLQIISIAFVICLIFNYLLQPFDVNFSEHKIPNFWICVVHSTTPIVLFFGIAFICRFLPETTDNWTIKKEIVLIFFLVLCTGISQFLIRDIIYNNPDNWSWHYLREEVSNSFLAGLFIGPLIIFINLNRQQHKNSENANRIAATLPHVEEVPADTTVTIETEVKSEKFSFDINSFIYAKAEGNYAEIFLNEDGKTNKLIKRIPIKNLETQLNAFPFIVKTHRSVLLNLNQIENVSGNAQGYKVTMKDCLEPVPVSRNYIQTFNIVMQTR
ncbi:LytTR family transcriptional regulator [Flavobacterium amniphilum]|uniref:LytR/AlgR family response regulator transcription factor n=1 Tax=Flavobacterium amniphilum TaxID=1834035 RepID=UPI00202A6C6B|nr:LytTR family DNA-binding domain-containing protein [Flavobacterium amniphilum]MCL9806584.1 LytTR family transcriptional regulator [Flavobacterium amniphilum]